MILLNMLVEENHTNLFIPSQIVTDNASNNKAAGRLIQATPGHGHVFWGGCAAHCADLYLAYIGRMGMVKDLLDRCNTVCKFMLNHHQPDAMMRAVSNTRLKRTVPTR